MGQVPASKTVLALAGIEPAKEAKGSKRAA
jgi:hypothetical protein